MPAGVIPQYLKIRFKHPSEGSTSGDWNSGNGSERHKSALFPREFVIHPNPVGFDLHCVSDRILFFQCLQCFWSCCLGTDLVPAVTTFPFSSNRRRSVIPSNFFPYIVFVPKPIILATLWSGSDRRGNFRLFFSANFFCATGGSGLTRRPPRLTERDASRHPSGSRPHR